MPLASLSPAGSCYIPLVMASRCDLASSSAGKDVAACLFGSNWSRNLCHPARGPGKASGLLSLLGLPHMKSVCPVSQGRESGNVNGEALYVCP